MVIDVVQVLVSKESQLMEVKVEKSGICIIFENDDEMEMKIFG